MVSLQCDKKLLERVEKFALHMVTKCWDLSYLELLDITGVLSLERRRDVARLCLLYKIVNCLCFFDLNIFFLLVPLALIIHILLL